MIDWNYVNTNALENPDILRLKDMGRHGLSPEERESIEESITQIECRRRYPKKFPGLIDLYPHFTFPSKLAAEQSSHLLVARLHALIACHILSSSTPEKGGREFKMFDMTAGLGLDFISLAEALTEEGRGALGAELDKHKAEVLKGNLIEVGLPYAEVIIGDSTEYLHDYPDSFFDLIFADPARRGMDDSRIYDPRDCQPDVVGIWEDLLNRSSYVMIKNSPMLDLDQARRFFPHTEFLAVISVKGECKEVLVIARKDAEYKGTLCINIKATEEFSQVPDILIDSDETEIVSETFLFIPADYPEESVAYADLINPGDYLYEPNSSVMKARPWSTLLRKFPDLRKLSPDCHIFTSTGLHRNFPGRILKIEHEINRRNRKELKGQKLNIISRAYPDSPEQIAKKLKIQTGGEQFICGLCISNRPVLILASPID